VTRPQLLRGRPGRALVLVDVRRYQHHVGAFVVADRLLLRGAWTPLVRVRLRHPRASEGGTEI